VTYKLILERRPTYLYAQVRGQNSPETVLAYLAELMEECHRRDCFRVLIDERLDGPRLEAGDVFSVASEGAMNALGVFHAIAYVDRHMGEMADFAETVAINRGMPVKIFLALAQAEAWIEGQADDQNEQRIFHGDMPADDDGMLPD